MGEPLDGRGAFFASDEYPLHAEPPHPLRRTRITEPLSTGIRSIDGLVTIGRGQRMGIFSGTGVGTSVLLGMMARYTDADLNVVALVGERGREVRDFLERDLGEEGLARSVVVVATSDRPALLRVRAAYVATAIAEYFRDQGKDVLFMMDSVTRVAVAQREIGLSTGEPPATKGYTPSVYAMLPKLLERSGRGETGSITGLYNVLVEADDLTEPVSDTVRGILDGHVWLSRELATRGHYPAVDVPNSISRVMIDVVSEEHKRAAEEFAAIISAYRQAEDLIHIGAYVDGTNPQIDRAKRLIGPIHAYLRQRIEERSSLEEARAGLFELLRPPAGRGAPAGGGREPGRAVAAPSGAETSAPRAYPAPGRGAPAGGAGVPDAGKGTRGRPGAAPGPGGGRP
jgi:flagellum-specific ATP synthase